MNDKNYVPLELRAPITVPELLRLMDINADLVAALQRSLNWLASYPGGNAEKTYNQAREAIAKART